MSKTQAPTKQRRPRTNAEVASLIEWVKTLNIGVDVTVKVNGHQHPTALVVVDLGSPLKQVRLTHEQMAELHQRLRRAGKEVMNKDVQTRPSADHQNGIHWVSVV